MTIFGIDNIIIGNIIDGMGKITDDIQSSKEEKLGITELAPCHTS